MSTRSTLFKPTKMGDLTLPNRVLMAPLTRNRAHSDGVPSEMAEKYYYQRASAGVIFSEATQISPLGKGYLDTPGIYSDEQVEAWSKITAAVHAGGGRIFCQLWHVGRISHNSLLPDDHQPLAPSAIKANTQTFTSNGFEDCSEPKAMSKEDIENTLKDFEHAARCAKDAGFDGVEVHSANGYLLDQFLQDGTNKREDEYGGSIDNRMRLLSQSLDAVMKVWDAGRVGVRLSPLGQANDIADSDRKALFTQVYTFLSGKKLAYIHVVERFPGNEPDESETAFIENLRKHYKGFYIANGDYDKDRAEKVMDTEHAQAITFGRPFIANPDLPERYRTDATLNEPDSDTFYGGNEKGYTDYPFLSEDR